MRGRSLHRLKMNRPPLLGFGRLKPQNDEIFSFGENKSKVGVFVFLEYFTLERGKF